MGSKAASTNGLLALVIVVLTITTIKMDAMAYDYALSGTNWPPTYCLTGKTQSPINIASPHIVYRGTTSLFKFGYALWVNYTISNNGHTIVTPLKERKMNNVGGFLLVTVHKIKLTSAMAPGDSEVVPQAKTLNLVQLFEGKFVLKQFHVHAPSEHTISGQLSAMEIHFVHANAKNASNLAVVSVLLRYHPNDVPNAWLDSFIGEVPTTVSSHDVSSPLNARALFLGGAVGTNNIGFYNYTGSLTTPKCNEGVHWYVLQKPQYLSVKQAIVFMNAISVVSGGERTNNRPPQPLNGRKIDAWSATQ